jgi:PHS family inorganic phosphate transporter-like MFS transporter
LTKYFWVAIWFEDLNKKQKMLANFLNNVAAAFNLTVMGLVLVSIASQIEEQAGQQSLVASAGLAGAVTGQIALGFLGDCIGRNRALALTTLLILIGSILSAVLPQGSSLLVTLAICRFVTGLGVGGVYPLTAVASVEEKGSKGVTSVLLVFSGQGWGQLLAPVTVYLLAVAKVAEQDIWRITLGLAAVPSLIALVLLVRDARRRMKEADFEAIGSILRIAGDHPANIEIRQEQERRAAQEFGAIEVQSFKKTFCSSRNLKKLLGTGGTWFIFDVTFYANVVFAPVVVERVFGLKSNSGAHEVAGPTCIVLLVALPGYYVALLLANRLGLKKLQMFGFIALAVLYGIMAITSDSIPPGVLFGLYSATFFFSNLGPNSTTFCLPSRTFPKASRTSFNGISAAMGKLGAVAGTAVFPPILQAGGAPAALGMSAIVALLGFFVTYLTVEDEFVPQAQRVARVGDSFVGLVEMGPNPSPSLLVESQEPADIGSKRVPFSSQNNYARVESDHPFAGLTNSSYQIVDPMGNSPLEHPFAGLGATSYEMVDPLEKNALDRV